MIKVGGARQPCQLETSAERGREPHKRPHMGCGHPLEADWAWPGAGNPGGCFLALEDTRPVKRIFTRRLQRLTAGLYTELERGCGFPIRAS